MGVAGGSVSRWSWVLKFGNFLIYTDKLEYRRIRTTFENMNLPIAQSNKTQGGTLNGESDFRRFIRWFRFPKEKGMQKKWVARVLHRIPDVNPESMFAFSEHFEEDDFVYRNLLKADMFSDDMFRLTCSVMNS